MVDTTLQDMSDVRDRVEGIRAVMVTTAGERGLLASRPMTVQKVDPDGDVWFLAGKDTDWIPAGSAGAANVAFVDDGTWISFAGELETVTDQSVIGELWDAMTDSWFPGGQDQAVALHLRTDTVHWWTGAGTLKTMFEVAKTKVTDQDRPDVGDRGTIQA